MNRYSVSFQEDGEFSVYKLEDRKHQAIAQLTPQIGNNLFALSLDGHQILLQPPDLSHLQSSPFLYGTPILFPPNRVNQGQLSILGQHYQLPKNAREHHIHGELGKKPWRIIETGSSDENGAFIRSQFRLSDHKEILKYFPHDLVFTLTYVLKNGQLTCRGEVSNEGTKAAPYALGFHPYFHLAPQAVEADAIRVKIGADQEWPVTLDGFVEVKPSDTELCAKLREGARFSDISKERYSFFSVRPKGNRYEIMDELQECNIVLDTDEHFPFVVVFRPSWAASSLSLEPYTCVTDCFNLDCLPEMSGARIIEAGETFRFAWRVSVKEKKAKI